MGQGLSNQLSIGQNGRLWDLLNREDLPSFLIDQRISLWFENSGLINHEQFLHHRDEIRSNNKILRLKQLGWGNELKRINKAFTDAGIEFILFKGLNLSNRLYGGWYERQFRDFDILFKDLSHILKARTVLHTLGYTDELTPFENHWQTFFKIENEFNVYLPNSPYLVECHLSPFKPLHKELRFLEKGLFKDLEIADSPFGPLASIPDNIMSQFLLYHGHKHHWAKLHWLIDFKCYLEDLQQFKPEKELEKAFKQFKPLEAHYFLTPSAGIKIELQENYLLHQGIDLDERLMRKKLNFLNFRKGIWLRSVLRPWFAPSMLGVKTLKSNNRLFLSIIQPFIRMARIVGSITMNVRDN